ncbi:MAG TPA: homoserine O-succinyltransferase, partial [Rhizomicrobium sp.]|nr:homoserine O-succinyltransferase [Rhizomicrobium sp.]
FDHTILSGHPLVQALPETVHVAHSRWNEVRRADLEASGYDILTEAAGAGVDLFIKQSRNLLVFHQGHPEYDAGTLFREYRRDIQRFLDRTSETYPQAPKNYFEEAEIDLLHGFRERAFAHRDEALLGDLPVTRRATNDNEAVSPMAGVYRAWLLRIATKGKLTVVPRPAPLPRFGGIHP